MQPGIVLDIAMRVGNRRQDSFGLNLVVKPLPEIFDANDTNSHTAIRDLTYSTLGIRFCSAGANPLGQGSSTRVQELQKITRARISRSSGSGTFFWLCTVIIQTIWEENINADQRNKWKR
jgi:hypothetical protein